MKLSSTQLKCATLALASVFGTALAQPCTLPPSKLVSPSPAAEDFFGWSVSMSFGGPNNRPLMAVGKPYEDSPAGSNVGGWSVWQYVNGNWNVAYDAWNSDGFPNEHAGTSIGLSDPYMIVGSPNFEFRGRARVLKRITGSNTWLLDDDLSTGIVQGSGGSDFGRAVAISAMNGGWAIVGAPYFSSIQDDSGRVDLYYRNAANQWINFYTMSGSNNGLATEFGNLGVSVSMSQTTEWAAWGAPGQTVYTQFPDSGTAYVMRRSDQVPTMLWRPSTDSETNLRFGASVAVEGDWLAIGAPGEDASPAESGLPNDVIDSGAVYLYHFENDAWRPYGTLRAPLPSFNGEFGTNVRMSGNQLVVYEFVTERVYVFNLVNGLWSIQATFEDPEGNADSSFGQSIAIRDGLLAMGDSVNDPNVISDAGAVYTTTISPTFASGDTCANPLPMPTDNFVGCTELATPSAGSITTCGNGASGQGPDVWFRFQPACDGNAIIDTFGSDFDTVLSVHSQCPDASGGHSIACNDDASFPAPNNRASLVTFNFLANHVYFVRVSGYNATRGQYSLRSLLTYGVSNDTCATAPTIAHGPQFQFNTCSATDSSGPVPLGTVRDIWYRFIAPSTGSYNFSTCGSAFDTVITLFNGSQSTCPSSAAAVIAQNDDNGICGGDGHQSFLTTTLTQGQSVMIRIGGAQPGDYGAGLFGIGQTILCDDIDFNNDTLFPDTQDINDFISVFAGGPCSTNSCGDIDFNNDSLFPDTLDIDALLSVFSGGPCLR